MVTARPDTCRAVDGDHSRCPWPCGICGQPLGRPDGCRGHDAALIRAAMAREVRS